MHINDFADQGPALCPEQFFVGRFEGWGLLEGPLGGQHGLFTVEARGEPDGPDAVSFREVWRFDNGHTDSLDWLIRRTAPGRYTGDETRLDGEAEGDQAGNAFHWRYTRDTPQASGGASKLHFDDWFWRVAADAMVVRGRASKLGVPFASAFVTYRKLAAA